MWCYHLKENGISTGLLISQKCNLLKNKFICPFWSYLLAMFVLTFSLVLAGFSISQYKTLPSTDARLITSLLHNDLIYSFEHWDYNHVNNFLLSITIIFYLDVNEFNTETTTYEKSYIKVKKWMSVSPIFLSVKEWITCRYTCIIPSTDRLTKIILKSYRQQKKARLNSATEPSGTFLNLEKSPDYYREVIFFKKRKWEEKK